MVRTIATELRTFFSTVEDYDIGYLLKFEYQEFSQYKGKTEWMSSYEYRRRRKAQGKPPR